MRYHNITKDDMLNGDGLRVVLWVAGCDHCCKECHNPVTWDPNGGLFFDEKAKAEIFEELEKDYISGITFSGGDPLHSANAYEVMMLAKEIKEKDGASLDKFENLIFSSIVSTSEQVPSTFDGLEHITNLIKSAKS